MVTTGVPGDAPWLLRGARRCVVVTKGIYGGVSWLPIDRVQGGVPQVVTKGCKRCVIVTEGE